MNTAHGSAGGSAGFANWSAMPKLWGNRNHSDLDRLLRRRSSSRPPVAVVPGDRWGNGRQRKIRGRSDKFLEVQGVKKRYGGIF